MIKSLVFFILLIFDLLSKDIKSINLDIKNTSSKIHAEKKEYSSIHSKLKKTTSKIIKEQKKLKEQKRLIKKLQITITTSKGDVNSNNIKLKELQHISINLTKTKRDIEQKLVNLVTKDYAFAILMQESNNKSLDDIIKSEIFKKYKEITKKELSNFSKEYKGIISKIDTYKNSIENIKLFISKKNSEKEALLKLQKDQKKIVAKLSKEKAVYKKRLAKVIKNKANLQNILAKLKVIKLKKNKKISNKKHYSNTNKADTLNVRQLGSSYSKAKLIKYRGKKHISPIKNYTILKEFGTYIDPVYKMKIFNDSIILKPTRGREKVKSVLSGKVVFAKNTPTLQKVVIVKHTKGYHTVYAHLDEIAPRIIGRNIPTGYVVGRVSNELMFQVTKQDGYVNPARFVKFK